MAGSKYMGWFKAGTVKWEALISAAREGGASDEIALLDLDYLNQVDRTLSSAQLAKRWGWSRSKAYRFTRPEKAEEKETQSRPKSETEKPAPAADVAKEVEQKRALDEEAVNLSLIHI